MTALLTITQQAIYTNTESYLQCGCVSVDETKYFTLKSDGLTLYQFTISPTSIGSRVALATLSSAGLDLIVDPTDSDALIIPCVDGIYRYKISTNALTTILSSTAYGTNTGESWFTAAGTIIFARGTKAVVNTRAQHGSFWEIDLTTGACSRLFKVGGYMAFGGLGPNTTTEVLFGIRYNPTALIAKLETTTGQLTVFSGTGKSTYSAGDALTVASYGELSASTGSNLSRTPAGDLFYFNSTGGGGLWAHNVSTGLVTLVSASQRKPLALFSAGTRAVVNSSTSVTIYS